MITKLRKIGEEAFVEIEHEADDCAACKAGCHTAWEGVGVIFFENEQGVIRRVENIGWPLLAFLCGEVSRQEADDELGKRFVLEPGEDMAELFERLIESGMRSLNCEDCGCPMLTRGTSNKCPPCRRKARDS